MIVSEYKKILVRGRMSASDGYEKLAMQGKAHTCYAMLLELRIEAIDEILAKLANICDNSIVDDVTYEVIA